MIPPGSEVLYAPVSIMVIIFAGYVSGRIHQFRRRADEREAAYRDGYDQASRTLFPLTVRSETRRNAAEHARPPIYLVPAPAPRDEEPAPRDDAPASGGRRPARAA